MELETLVPLRISARNLGALEMPGFCPGCFWLKLHVKKFPFQIPMPGIFNSIDSYTKKVIHAVYDENSSLPTCLEGIGDVKGYVDRLHYTWYNHEDPETGVMLTGTPDDIFQLVDDSYHIVDYKTARVTKTQDELFPLYLVQLNAYAYIAERLTDRGGPFSPVSGACLVYFEPYTDIDDGELVDFAVSGGFDMRFKATVKPVEPKADEMIPPLLRRAREIYDQEQAPEHIEDCKDLELLNQLTGSV